MLCRKNCCCIKNEWYVFHVSFLDSYCWKILVMTLWKNVFAFISCRRKWENFPKNDLCCLLNFRLSLGSHLRDRRGNWIYNSTRFLIAFQIQLDCLFATLFFRNLNWNFLSFSQKPVKLFSLSQAFDFDLEQSEKNAAYQIGNSVEVAINS